MTAQQYLDKYTGQSLLYNPTSAREYLRGQCVQGVSFFVTANGAPMVWVDTAYEWWLVAASRYPDNYERITNSQNAVPQPGDIAIWDWSLANSGGAGHIAVVLYARAGTGTFVSVDQNWGGKTVHAVTHNYDKVVGWLRIKSRTQTAVQVVEQDEMIATRDYAVKAYWLLRPNGGMSENEIMGAVGKSWAKFVEEAQPEVAARNRNWVSQLDKAAELQRTIDQLNQTITDIKVTDTKSLQDYQTKIAQLTAQLTTNHDELADLQVAASTVAADSTNNSAPVSKVTPTNYSWLTKVIASVMKKK